MDAALDVTVVSPLQQALLTKASEQPGAALAFAKERKDRQSQEACRKAGVSFLALPIETLGRYHEMTSSPISRISRALSSNSARPPSQVASHLFQRLGILLAKGNAALVLSRAPHPTPPELDGDHDGT